MIKQTTSYNYCQYYLFSLIGDLTGIFTLISTFDIQYPNLISNSDNFCHSLLEHIMGHIMGQYVLVGVDTTEIFGKWSRQDD